MIDISVILYLNEPFGPEISPTESWASGDAGFGCLKKNWHYGCSLWWSGSSVPAGGSGEGGLLWIEVTCAVVCESQVCKLRVGTELEDRRGLSLGPSVPCQEVVSIPRSDLSSIILKDPKIFNGIRN